MKKFLIIALATGTLCSLFGSEYAPVRDFENILEDSLFEVPGALDELRKFVQDNPSVKQNKDSTLELLKHLDGPIFSARDSVAQIFQSDYCFEKNEKSVGEIIAENLRKYMQNKRGEQFDPFFTKMIVFSTKKYPFEYDAYRFNPDDPKSKTIGEALLSLAKISAQELRELAQNGGAISEQQRVTFLNLSQVAGLVSTQRILQLIEVTSLCLMGKGNIQDLKASLERMGLTGILAGKKLKDVLAENKDFLKKNGFAGLPLDQLIWNILGPLSEKRDEVFKAVFPHDPIPTYLEISLPGEALPSIYTMVINTFISLYVRSALKGKPLNFAIIEYLYRKYPLCVDDYTFDQLSLTTKVFGEPSPDQGMPLAVVIDRFQAELWAQPLVTLVKEKRFDKKQYCLVLNDCLLEKKPLTELKKFVKGHSEQLLLDTPYEEDGHPSPFSVKMVVLKYNPFIFKKRNEILKIIAPTFKIPDFYPEVTEQERKRRIDDEVATSISNYLDSKGRPGAFEKLSYMYAQAPICLDAYSLDPFDSTDTLGRKLDEVKDTDYARMLSIIVQEHRWARAINDPKRKALGRIILKALIGVDEENETQLAYYVNDPSLMRAGYEELTIGNLSVGFTFGDKKEITVHDFLQALNPRLFPRKGRVADLLKQKRPVKEPVYTQKSDAILIEKLVTLSIENKDFRPLLKFTYNNYENLYRAQIDLKTIDYKGETVHSFLKKQESAADYDYYDNLFYSDSSSKKEQLENQLAQRKVPVALWKKLLGVASVGIASYALYKYYQPKKLLKIDTPATQVA